MNYSLSNMLSSNASGIDSDAKAYIDAVVAGGGTVSGTQRNAINTFYKTGKTDGWYSSIKRLYLPIWAVAAPNAIDMVARTSGTFAGTVTHAAGYVQGNGSTGKFTSDTNGNAVGMTSSTGGMGALCLLAPTGVGFAAMGGMPGATDALQLYHNAGTIQCSVAGSPPLATFSGTRATNTGIWVSSRVSTTSLSLYRRTTSGFSTPATNTTSVAGNTVSTSNITFMSQISSIYSDGRFGAFFFNLGMTAQQATDFTLALKNLWESATGLTLP